MVQYHLLFVRVLKTWVFPKCLVVVVMCDAETVVCLYLLFSYSVHLIILARIYRKRHKLQVANLDNFFWYGVGFLRWKMGWGWYYIYMCVYAMGKAQGEMLLSPRFAGRGVYFVSIIAASENFSLSLSVSLFFSLML